MSDEKRKVFLLDGTNYLTWKRRIVARLDEKGLRDALNLADVPGPEKKKERSDFYKARGIIVGTLDDERLEMITDEMSPKEIMDEFEKRYKDTTSTFALAMALREMVKIKPEVGQMAEYFKKFDSQYSKARRLGLPEIDQKWQVFWIIANMPEQLDLDFSLSLRKDADFDVYKVKQQILDEESRQQWKPRKSGGMTGPTKFNFSSIKSLVSYTTYET